MIKHLFIKIPLIVSKIRRITLFPIVLKKVDLSVFEKLLFDNYGIELFDEEKEWFAGDGKELRGSIETGDKRGEALVQLVRHSDRSLLGQSRYNGKKESEKPCLQNLLSQTGALKQKITADALHLSPATTASIAKAEGIFVIGLKDNQRELLADMEKCTAFLEPTNQTQTIDKGHGRLEKRSYFQYDVSGEYFDPRWASSNFQSLFRVERSRLVLKTGKESQQVAYYISNGSVDEHAGYFEAIRNHWSVETANHVRDVTLQEDQLRTKKSL